MIVMRQCVRFLVGNLERGQVVSWFKVDLKCEEYEGTRGMSLLYRQEHLPLEPTDIAMTRGVVHFHAYPAQPRGRKAMADTWQTVPRHGRRRRPMNGLSTRLDKPYPSVLVRLGCRIVASPWPEDYQWGGLRMGNAQ